MNYSDLIVNRLLGEADEVDSELLRSVTGAAMVTVKKQRMIRAWAKGMRQSNDWPWRAVLQSIGYRSKLARDAADIIQDVGNAMVDLADQGEFTREMAAVEHWKIWDTKVLPMLRDKVEMAPEDLAAVKEFWGWLSPEDVNESEDEDMAAHLKHMSDLSTMYVARYNYGSAVSRQLYFHRGGAISLRPDVFTASEKAQLINDPRFKFATWERAPYHIAMAHQGESIVSALLDGKYDSMLPELAKVASAPRLYYAYIFGAASGNKIYLDASGKTHKTPVALSAQTKMWRQQDPHWRDVTWAQAPVKIREGDDPMLKRMVGVAVSSPWAKASTAFDLGVDQGGNPWTFVLKALGHKPDFVSKIGNVLRQVVREVRRSREGNELAEIVWDTMRRMLSDHGMTPGHVEIIRRLYWRDIKRPLPMQAVREGYEDMLPELGQVAADTPWVKIKRAWDEYQQYDNPWIPAFRILGYEGMAADRLISHFQRLKHEVEQFGQDPEGAWNNARRYLSAYDIPEEHIEILHRLWGLIKPGVRESEEEFEPDEEMLRDVAMSGVDPVFAIMNALKTGKGIKKRIPATEKNTYTLDIEVSPVNHSFYVKPENQSTMMIIRWEKNDDQVFYSSMHRRGGGYFFVRPASYLSLESALRILIDTAKRPQYNEDYMRSAYEKIAALRYSQPYKRYQRKASRYTDTGVYAYFH